MTSVGARYDVCIVGGSVAGSAAAIALSRLGLSVAVIERQAAFRDRARGEGIHPWGMDEAEELDLLDLLDAAGAQPLPVWLTYVDRSPLEPFRWEEESARGQSEHGVYHPRLQEMMIGRAEALGVTLYRPAALTAIDRGGEDVTVTFEQAGTVSSLRAAVVVGADGTHSRTRTLAGIGSKRDSHHHWFVGVLVDGFSGDPNAAHAGLLPGGRFFVLPQGGGLARVYAALMPSRVAAVQADRSGRALIEMIARQLPEGMLEGVRSAGPQGIFSNADVWSVLPVADRVVLIGDAAGTNDPSVGHGISLAFRDVRELRDRIRDVGLGQEALEWTAAARDRYYGTLREYASWMATLWLEEGTQAEVRRARFQAARETDPDAGGFNTITALGPRDLVADAPARARFFGEATEPDASPS